MFDYLKKPECYICKRKFKKEDFIGVIGIWPGMLPGLTPPFKPLKLKEGKWPYLRNPKFYCKSCFNKQFKKK